MVADRGPLSFYLLSPARGSAADTAYSTEEPLTLGDASTCPTCNGYIGKLSWLPPRYAQVVVYGERAGDFAFFSSSDFLVSDVVVAALQNHGLTGITNLQEVEVTSMLRSATISPRRYYFGEVSLNGGRVDPARSDVEYDDPCACDDCRGSSVRAIRGFTIEASSWSGEDIFVPRAMPGTVVVSEAFRRVAVEQQFSNIGLLPTEQYRRLP